MIFELAENCGGRIVSHADPIWNLILQWERAQAQGQSISAETLCSECPDRLADFLSRIADLESIRRQAAAEGTRMLAADSPTVTYASGDSETAARERMPADVPGYEVVGRVGQGGMGAVYQARQLGLNRLVALKVLIGGAAAGSDRRARFAAEAKVVAALRHPNIVSVFDTGEYDGVPFFSMEFVPGGTLGQRLAAGPLAPETAARLMVPVVDAIQHAHDHGVIHRDLKPTNILISEDGAPKVSDFGLAKQLESDDGLTRTDAVLGTPSYMAPEQAEGKKQIGPAADVYALGAILYHALTGRPPFQAATTLDTLRQVVERDPVPVRDLQPAVPRDLAVICEMSLRKEPERRYPSAGELAADLRRYLANEPIRARAIGPIERAWKWGRRHRGAALSGLAVSLALFVGTIVSGIYAGRATAAAKREATARSDLEVQKGNALMYIKFVLDILAQGDELRAELLTAFLNAHPGLTRDEWRQAFTWTPPEDGNYQYVVHYVHVQNKIVPVVVKEKAGLARTARKPEAGTSASATFNPRMFGD
jgi:eukaryotic-like serine/threonine-protein kinase